MTEKTSPIAHLSVAMTTEEVDTTTSTDEMSSSSDNTYIQLAVLVIGLVGTAGNAVVLYALFASMQHKKHALIVNQNVLDLFSSFFLVVSFAIQLCNPYLSGVSGYWVCIFLYSGVFTWSGVCGSVVNLAVITIDRYLKVVHPVWSKNRLKPWMIHSAMAFSWFAGIVSNIGIMLGSTRVIYGVCYGWVFFKSKVDKAIAMIWYILSFYVIILVIFIYCYGRILAVVRRQARVMAGHGAAGSSTSHIQTKIQTNVIKTMIIVSAFYAIAWLPSYINYVFLMMDLELDDNNNYFNATVFIAYTYICANPFVYAMKFDPVREKLISMIQCKKKSSEQSVSGTRTA